MPHPPKAVFAMVQGMAQPLSDAFLPCARLPLLAATVAEVEAALPHYASLAPPPDVARQRHKGPGVFHPTIHCRPYVGAIAKLLVVEGTPDHCRVLPLPHALYDQESGFYRRHEPFAAHLLPHQSVALLLPTLRPGSEVSWVDRRAPPPPAPLEEPWWW